MSKSIPHLLKKATFFLFLGFSQIANAWEPHSYDDCYDNYNYECCHHGHHHFNISAELLYFKATIDQSAFVITSSDTIVGGEFDVNGQRHLNASSYKPAFRVEAMYDLCQQSNALDFRFTFFNSGHKSSVTSAVQVDTIGYPGDGAQFPEDIYYAGTASIHDHYKYYGVDLTLNRLSVNSCLDNITMLFGLHFAKIDHNTYFTSTGLSPDGAAFNTIDNSLNSHSNFWGIGPQLGIDYTYDIICPCYGQFSINANARGSVLCSKTNATFHYSSLHPAGTEVIGLHNDDLWRVTPAFDWRIGGVYRFALFCMDATIECGYEWIWYSDSVDAITGYDVAFPGDSFDLYSNFSLHGPFLKLGIDF